MRPGQVLLATTLPALACWAPAPVHRASPPPTSPAATTVPPPPLPAVDDPEPPSADAPIAASKPPPMRFLDSDTTYFLVEVYAGKAHCQRFDVDAASDAMSTWRGELRDRIPFQRTRFGIVIEAPGCVSSFHLKHTEGGLLANGG